MMTETLRWIDTATSRQSATAICVEIGGEAAEKLREHYGQEGGEVIVTHALVLRGERSTWSAELRIGSEVVHREPGEVTVTEHSTASGDDEWTTRLTGGHRMIRHLIEVTG